MSINIKSTERSVAAQEVFKTKGAMQGGERQNAFNLPKAKYNFLVQFTLSDTAKRMIADMHGTAQQLGRMTSFVIKDVDKPSFNMTTEKVNQYNRPRLVQGKIEYQPINLTVYDTVDSAALLLIDAYRRYYYGDFSDKSLKSWKYDTISNPQQFEYVHPLTPNDFEQGDDDTGDYSWGRSVFNMGDQNEGYFFTRIDIYEIDGSVYTVHNIHNPVIEAVQFDNKSMESEGEPSSIALTLQYEGVTNICPETKNKAIARPTAELVSILNPDQADAEFNPMQFFKFWGENDRTPFSMYDENAIRGFPISRGVGEDFSVTSLVASGVAAAQSVAGLVDAVTSGDVLDVASNVKSAIGEGTAASSVLGDIGSGSDALKSIGGLF